MSEQLKTMLRDAAGDHPDLTLRGDPWHHGRRIRLRRRLAGVAGAAVTATAVVAGTVLLTTPGLTSAPEPAREEPPEPALPNTLYDVPPNVADISDDPLGEPAAVVYHDVVHTGVYSDGTRPIVVGAVSGKVRAVRGAAAGGQAALSPDGTKLALARAWPVPSSGQGPPTVTVVELLTGDVSRHTLPDRGLGGGVDQLTWAPDNVQLSVTAVVTTEIGDGRSGGAGEEIYGQLDLLSGTWREDSLGTRLAFSSGGERMVVDSPADGATMIRSSDGSDPVDIELGDALGVSFSPDDEEIAAVVGADSAVASPDTYELVIFDAATGNLAARIELGEYSYVSLTGWGERGIMIESVSEVTSGVDGRPDYRVRLERLDLTDPDNPKPATTVEDQSLSGRTGLATAYIDADTRVAVPPEAGFDWVRWVPEPLLLVLFGVVAVPLILAAIVARRRRSAAVTAAAESESSPLERPNQ